jgi:uncharacterized protein YukE
MSWYGDPDALDRLAAALDRDAARVRERAAAVRAVPAGAHWRGPAADAFHSSVVREAAALDGAARELDDAAAALRRHAGAVREQLARIRALEHAVTSWFSSQLSRLEHVVTDPLGSLRDLVADPPWASWQWRPDALPVSGAMEWLDVGDYLRTRGVPL